MVSQYFHFNTKLGKCGGFAVLSGSCGGFAVLSLQHHLDGGRSRSPIAACTGSGRVLHIAKVLYVLQFIEQLLLTGARARSVARGNRARSTGARAPTVARGNRAKGAERGLHQMLEATVLEKHWSLPGQRTLRAFSFSPNSDSANIQPTQRSSWCKCTELLDCIQCEGTC